MDGDNQMKSPTCSNPSESNRINRAALVGFFKLREGRKELGGGGWLGLGAFGSRGGEGRRALRRWEVAAVSAEDDEVGARTG